MTAPRLCPLPLGSVTLSEGTAYHRRFVVNRRYVMSLQNEHLLQNYWLEAGLWSHIGRQGPDIHWGWESPTCLLRGHFLGHWLSAAAYLWALTGDAEVKAKADAVIEELGRCQRANGGEWCFSIPEKYFRWLAEGRVLWAPHYVVHKTLMGLLDMATVAHNEQALQIAGQAAAWFIRWVRSLPEDGLQRIFEISETGGMMEAWADLYALTGKPEHLDLMLRYERRDLFRRLCDGEDVLSRRHANTTVPEAHGMARAYEITGDLRFRDAVEAYWRIAVDRRDSFCTGAADNGEAWIPPGQLGVNLGPTTQEHCVVYNMMRLAEFLLRWTGDSRYADAYECRLINGVLAQQHPETGMVTYYLALEPGAVKKWSTPTGDFWCCVGTAVQAHSRYPTTVAYAQGPDLLLAQYIPGTVRWKKADGSVLRLTLAPLNILPTGLPWNSAQTISYTLTIHEAPPHPQAIVCRVPGWAAGTPTVTLNGEPESTRVEPSGFLRLCRPWRPEDRITLAFPKALQACSLPGDPERVAWIEGPVVLAGVTNADRTLAGDPARPGTMLLEDDARPGSGTHRGYRTRSADPGFRFIPLFEIRDEPYTVYFRVVPQRGSPG